MNIEDIKIYLPKYLSSESLDSLREALKDFQISADRLYTISLKDEKIIYQGDCIDNLLFVNLPENEIKKRRGLVLSNTCDISPDNTRPYESRMVYAPIVNLNDYVSGLEKMGIQSDKIQAHVVSLRKQHITQIFFLPAISGVMDDSFVFLDRLNNLPQDYVNRDDLVSLRKFTLSNFGHYLFLLKLSFHFNRFQDKVDRGLTSVF